jgi:hypothetical protein
MDNPYGDAAEREMMASGVVIEGKFDRNYDQLRIGFLKGSNPSAFKRLMTFATLNAARTLQKPIKDKAPKGETGKLQKQIKARKARFNNPAAVVGIKGGRTGVFYGWLVVGGTGNRRTTKNGTFAVKPVKARPFVADVVKRKTNMDRAVESYSKTISSFLNDEPFRNTILKFKRGNQR